MENMYRSAVTGEFFWRILLFLSLPLSASLRLRKIDDGIWIGCGRFRGLDIGIHKKFYFAAAKTYFLSTNDKWKMMVVWWCRPIRFRRFVFVFFSLELGCSLHEIATHPMGKRLVLFVSESELYLTGRVMFAFRWYVCAPVTRSGCMHECVGFEITCTFRLGWRLRFRFEPLSNVFPCKNRISIVKCINDKLNHVVAAPDPNNEFLIIILENCPKP